MARRTDIMAVLWEQQRLSRIYKSAVAKFAKGKGSVLDELSRNIGTKDWRQFGEYIASNPGAKKLLKYCKTLTYL